MNFKYEIGEEVFYHSPIVEGGMKVTITSRKFYESENLTQITYGFTDIIGYSWSDITEDKLKKL